MHILLCNDDGYQALGIQTLARSLLAAGHRVTIVAPSEERSGQSHAVSFFRPVQVKLMTPNTHAVWGTPADCAVIALLDILKSTPPDLVMSGINHGLNVGWDVNYSGTVGAATEATLLGYKAVALSLDSERLTTPEALLAGFESTARIACQIAANIHSFEWPGMEVLNINHPGTLEPKGLRVTGCGAHSMYVPHLERLEGSGPRHEGSRVYLIGGSARRNIADPSQDVSLIQEGFVTLSFLQARQSSTDNTLKLEPLAAAINI